MYVACEGLSDLGNGPNRYGNILDNQFQRDERSGAACFDLLTKNKINTLLLYPISASSDLALFS